MKFQANNPDYQSQNQVESIFLGNEAKALALILSNVPGTADHYLEWNDQSNACINGVQTIRLSGAVLELQLTPAAAEQVGETGFHITLECDEATYEGVLRGLKLIFREKLEIKASSSKPKAPPAKDYSKIRYLNLEGKNLKVLPDYVQEMAALETAKLGHNPKLDLQAACEVLAQLPHLKELNISAEAIIPESLGKLSALETLHIGGLTKPCSLPDSFGQLSKLKYLMIMSDSEVILPESFAELRNLEHLYFRVEAWKMPSRFYQLTRLKQLDFSGCRFTRLPEEMARMSAVETVIIDGPEVRDYDQILAVLAQMPNLKSLELDVKPVPQAIRLCKNIEELTICTGDDPEHPLVLPEALFELTQLRVLYLNRNYFEKIPDGIGRMTGLRELVLRESSFKTLPESIGGLSNLELLNLSENPELMALPERLGELTQLKDLYLDGNPQLTELPLSLKNLKQLSAVRISKPENVKNIPEGWDKLMAED